MSDKNLTRSIEIATATSSNSSTAAVLAIDTITKAFTALNASIYSTKKSITSIFAATDALIQTNNIIEKLYNSSCYNELEIGVNSR
jgi:hypothetical protein